MMLLNEGAITDIDMTRQDEIHLKWNGTTPGRKTFTQEI